MATNFFGPPPGVQAVVSGQVSRERASLGNVFDALLGLRVSEQEKARELFKTLAASNPGLATFVLQNTDLGEALVETPRTIAPKGEKPLAKRVTGAFQEAKGKVGLASLKPEQFRLALKFVSDRFQAFKAAGGKIPEGVNEAQAIEGFANAMLQGDLSLAGLPDDFVGALLSSKPTADLGIGATIVKLLTEANPDMTAEEKLNQLIGIQNSLAGRSEEILALTEQLKTGLLDLRTFQTERAEILLESLREGKPLGAKQLAEGEKLKRGAQREAETLRAVLAAWPEDPEDDKAVAAARAVVRNNIAKSPTLMFDLLDLSISGTFDAATRANIERLMFDSERKARELEKELATGRARGTEAAAPGAAAPAPQGAQPTEDFLSPEAAALLRELLGPFAEDLITEEE